jgi:multidrug efflux pump
LISRFFIDRPIFASVLSILITLTGALAIFSLPLALYPPISPPVVQVECSYPGASAQVVSETVATPIEQQVNGVENMLYMSSQCTNDGAYNLTVTFKHGIDLNMAQVLVQNRVALAIPLLPDVIKQTGVNVRKKSPDILLVIALTSKNGRYDQLYMSNYATMQMKEELARVPGVSDVTMMAQRDYSMRIWLDPDKLASRSMTSGDVVRALREQNAQVATGQIGQQPAPDGQKYQVTLSTLGRLRDVEQFGAVIVKNDAEGRVVRLRDVARVELGAKNSDIAARVNGKPCVSLAVFQLPDANALDTAVLVKNKIDELHARFPEGLDYEIRYDTTPFIQESIGEVVKTLREAVLLVAIVVLLFLQSWRSAIIPLIAVPVAIIGSFAVLAVFGFSLNNLTLFGLVLAIGIVVDDAIVVVEAVEHHIEHGLPPRQATIRAMEEVSGPVIAIGLVLSAVFIPCAFISGIVGQFFRQFALTIAVSTIISAFNSLTLSPALAALLLKPRNEDSSEVIPRLGYFLLGAMIGFEYLAEPIDHRWHFPAGAPPFWVAGIAGAVIGGVVMWGATRPLNAILGWLFGRFNAGFQRSTRGYTRAIGGMIRVSALVLLVYGGLLGITYWRFAQTPHGFIPSQDMGYLLVNVQLPDSTSAERTMAAMDKIEEISRATPGVRHSQAMSGMSILLSANGSNFGSMFLILAPYHDRPNPTSERFFRWLASFRQVYFEPYVGEATVRNWFGRPTDRSWFGPGFRGYKKPLYDLSKLEKPLRKLFRSPPRPLLTGDAIQNELRKQYALRVPEAIITVLGPPPVRGVGRAGGFKLMVEDRGDNGSKMLQGQTENLNEKALEQKSSLVGMTSVFRANVPQIYADIDRIKCMTKQVSLGELFATLRIYLGSLYVNDFNLFGRTWQVIVQAEPGFRNKIENASRLKVRNAAGDMVPMGSLMDAREEYGPLVLTRYNMYPAAPLNGAAAPGVSSGQAIQLIEQLADKELLKSMAFEWTDLAYLEIQAGNTAMIIFGFAVVMVFLVLAAQYESWSLPLAVILVVPMCLLSAICGINLVGEDINIFTQIGFVVLVGLASKNAILIVEFAKMRRREGESSRQATLDACQLRLRPIIMTSLAFILGVVPLLLGQGAGAEMRRTLGITVFSGMLGVTIFGIFLTPIFFYVIDRLGETRLFASPRTRRVGKILLFILTLGVLPFLNWTSRLAGGIRRSRRPGKPRPLEHRPDPAEAQELVEQK